MMKHALLLAGLLAVALPVPASAQSGTQRIRTHPADPDVVQVLSEGQWITVGKFDRRTGRFVSGQSPEAHGADGRCSRGSNDTAAVQAFLDAIRDGGSGTMNGCYIVDAGVLRLSPSPGAPLVSTGAYKTHAAPLITGNARIQASGKGSGPLLSIKNGEQSSGNGEFYAGGSLGNITFYDQTRRPGQMVGGLHIQGLFSWRIGQLLGQSLGGPLFDLSARTVEGNPDAYGSGGNEIMSVVCTSCRSPSVNMPTLTDSGQSINFVGAYGAGDRDTSTSNGALASGGQGTVIKGLSALATRGWAATYGVTDIGNRQVNHAMELHATENGLWVAGLYNSSLRGRINYGKMGKAPVWPLTAIKLGGAGKSVRQVDIDFQIRLDEPATLADITSRGTLIDLSNDPNLVDVTIRLTISGNAAATPFARDGSLRVPVDALVKNRAAWAGVTVILNGKTVVTPRKG